MRNTLLGIILPLAILAAPLVQAEGLNSNDPRIRLLEAIVKDDARTVQDLLAKGVDPNVREAKRGPAVVMAASEGALKSLKQIADAPATDLNATNDKGETALMLVAKRGHVDSVQYLLKRGASVNHAATGSSALHVAAANGQVDVMDTLIASRANLNARMDNGTTPLMAAVRLGQFTAYQTLLKAGADPTITDNAKLSAVELLEQRGESERARLLRDYIKNYKQQTAKK